MDVDVVAWVVALLAMVGAAWSWRARTAAVARAAAATAALDAALDAAEPRGATHAARELRVLLDHLAWVTAVGVHTPARRALDDLLSLRSTRIEALDIGERHLLDGAIASTEQGLRLLDDLRAWATTPPAEVAAGPVDLRAALDDAVELLDDDGHVTLDVEPLGTATGDHDLLVTALHTALDNCVRYRWPGRPVHVRVELADVQGPDRVTVWVHDDGLGVDPDAQDRLWLPFTRGNGASAMAGVGLGLPTLRRALRAMDGDARFVAHEGRGSTLEIDLVAG